MFGDNRAMIDRVMARFGQAGAKLLDDIANSAEMPSSSPAAHKLKGQRAPAAPYLGDLAAALEEVRAPNATWARCRRNGGGSPRRSRDISLINAGVQGTRSSKVSPAG